MKALHGSDDLRTLIGLHRDWKRNTRGRWNGWHLAFLLLCLAAVL